LKNYLEIGGDLAAAELDQFRHGVPGFEMQEASGGIQVAVGPVKNLN
jgi:hypothetical protein